MNLEGGDLPKKLLSTGSHRICPVQETLERIRPHMLAFGITRLANVTGLDNIGLPVALAVRPNARSIAVSQGKGETVDHAKASALMESIEVWHAEHVTMPLHWGTVRDVAARRRLIDLKRLPETSVSPFTESLRMLWAPAVELLSGEDVLLPFEMIHADYTHPVQPGHGCFPASTNGLASGNHLVEAICHGLCEVIERDAVAIWHQAPLEEQAARRVDHASVNVAECQQAFEMIGAAGLECGVWDVTSDVEVASFLAIVTEPAGTVGHLGLGSGTHPDRDVALFRALSEAAQTRLNYISGAREDLTEDEYAPAGLEEKEKAFGAMLSSRACPRRFDQVPSRVNEKLDADLDWLIVRLRDVGINEVAVVDLTREEFGIPVARVVVPGLEAPHDDESYVPGPRARRGWGEALTA